MTEQLQRRLTAIVAADLAGYSRLIGEDEEATLSALRFRRSSIVNPLLEQHGGRIANTAGDSLLIAFASAADAVRFSIAMQRAMAEANGEAPEPRHLWFRIGINIGDVVVEDGDLFGDAVNITARLEAIAPSGGIVLADDVYRQIRGRIDAEWTGLGLQALKNIAEPVRAWAWTGTSPLARPGTGAVAARPDARPEKAAIAVMPFENRSGDQEQRYFADGITEDIITELSRKPELMVISRNSTFAYQGKSVPPGEICRELGVRYLLEGSVRRANDRVRITAQLVDGETAGHLWAERYDRDMSDIFAVQDDVTRHIVSALAIKLVNSRPVLAGKGTANAEAYDLVLRAREQFRLYTAGGNAAARRLFQQAAELDPYFAEAFAGIALTHVQEWFAGSEAALALAHETAQTAAALDPTLPLVQEALSTVHLFRREHDAAIETARRWIDLEPSNAEAYATLAGAMHFAGHNGEVIGLIETAERLNPHYPFYYPHYVGLANFAVRRWAEAIAAFNRAITRNPDTLWPHVFLSAAYAHSGAARAAKAALTEVARLDPDFSLARAEALLSYKRRGDLALVLDGLGSAGLKA